MNFKDYQQETASTAVYPEAGEGTTDAVIYTAFGLVGEAGEVAEHIKKMLRDDDGTLTPDRRAKLKKELGDVQWYLARLCAELDFDLADVAEDNLDKLQARLRSNNLHGEGSDR